MLLFELYSEDLPITVKTETYINVIICYHRTQSFNPRRICYTHIKFNAPFSESRTTKDAHNYSRVTTNIGPRPRIDLNLFSKYKYYIPE